MERKSIIAIVGAAAGVLVAGSVAGVAVINAASASTTKPETMVLTAASQAQSAPVVLPELPIPSITITPEGNESTTAPSAATIATQDINAKEARSAVVNASGGSVLATSRVVRDGFEAYGVQVARTDGSVVTGFVDANSGVIFSWVVDKEAPVAVSNYEDDDEYEDDEERDNDDD